MQRPRTPAAPDEEPFALWYELGRLYSEAGGGGQRATKLGFTVVCVAGALVLLSAPLFGTAWAGPFAAGIPVAAGVLSGGGLFLRQRARLRSRVGAVRERLEGRGLDAACPAREGLDAYYDAQLVLLRSEYEYLLRRGASKACRIFEETFGFTPEDPFESGPLNVAPDTEGVRSLRGRWERRLAARRQRGIEPPALGLREDAAYRVFPREMTVPVELSMRRAYLTISHRLLVERYGRDPRGKLGLAPEELRRRAERDLREYAVLCGRPTRGS
ncbi:MAG: hypothetical protein M3151_12495 [Actinomycetota bacterium]|nr:hypothetical protein [Actinomycetota bacterium]